MQGKSVINLRDLHHDGQALSSNLKRALVVLSSWLNKNVGSAEHTKALKMQKLILIEYLATERA